MLGDSRDDRPASPPPRLADVVSARLALSRLLNVSASSPWVCFGGSYAGSLAAWARLQVPGLLGADTGVGWAWVPSRVKGALSPHTLPAEGLSRAVFTRVRDTEGGAHPGPLEDRGAQGGRSGSNPQPA